MIGNDQIALYGGSSDENEKLDDFWLFDIGSKRWLRVDQNQGSDCPGPRSGLSIVHYQGNIVLFGGIYEVTNELNDIFAFSLQTRTWKIIE